MPQISIIIPFYQKKEGILRKALKSVDDQSEISDYDVIIVDDSSPCSCEHEISGLSKEFEKKIKIVKQKNSGPAGARNKGLDSVKKGTRYVAFLDSDDIWTNIHLKNAFSVLEKGYDFYFADSFQLEQKISAFNRAQRISLKDHKTIDESGNYEYIGNFQNQIVTGNVVGTSTVVYRFEKFPDLRFREDLVLAGEDYVFWLSIASRAKKIAFGSVPSCYYGKGINVYSGSGWGSTLSIDLIYFEIKYRKIIMKDFNLTISQKTHIMKNIQRLRDSFTRDILHRFFNRKPMRLSVIKNLFVLDPVLFFCFPYLLVKIFAKKGFQLTGSL